MIRLRSLWRRIVAFHEEERRLHQPRCESCQCLPPQHMSWCDR